jgi:hypothetical protein
VVSKWGLGGVVVVVVVVERERERGGSYGADLEGVGPPAEVAGDIWPLQDTARPFPPGQVVPFFSELFLCGWEDVLDMSAWLGCKGGREALPAQSSNTWPCPA